MSSTRNLTTSLGHEITVFCNDHVGDKIAAQGLYEPENLSLLIDLIGKIRDPLVLDIGANIGNHSLALATRAATVHAFEPIPAIYRLLEQNIRQNQLANVHAHCCALSDSPGMATIYMVKEGNAGASSFDQRQGSTEPVEVHKVTGDDFVREHRITKVSLVKIDVEAHEVFVLRGLMQTLQRDLPWITLEWNDPLTIERLSNSPEMTFLLEHYTLWVLGSNYDRSFWSSKAFGFVRRKLTRLLKRRRALLYPFNASRLYKNLLLVPKGQDSLLSPRYFEP
jgi:FkbM family methyltransferase